MNNLVVGPEPLKDSVSVELYMPSITGLGVGLLSGPEELSATLRPGTLNRTRPPRVSSDA